MNNRFLLVASFAESVLKFRGALIDTLLERGVNVHLAVPDLSVESRVYLELKEKGVEVHPIKLQRTGLNPLSDFRSIWQLFRLIRRIGPSVVLAYTAKPVIYGIFAAGITRVPRRFALITGLGFAFTNARKGFLPEAISVMYRMSLRYADKVFFQNPDDEATFVSRNIIRSSASSVVVNGSGVDLSIFDVDVAPALPVSFLMIARLLGDKGIREYARAARTIRSNNVKVVFRLIGWIDENPDAISQGELDGWINDGDIEFLGRLDDVRPAIANCSVYVLPSYREGTPRTVLEAMAMGRPVITTDAPGCRETVIEGENGYLVEVKSVDGLVEAMRRFIEDPDIATVMGRRSREIAEEKYDVHKVNAVMLREMGIE